MRPGTGLRARARKHRALHECDVNVASRRTSYGHEEIQAEISALNPKTSIDDDMLHLVCRIRLPFRRATRMRSSRAALLVLLLFFLPDLLSLSGILSRRPPPATLHSSFQRVYITAIHWNNEVVLRSNWNKAVLELAKHLGPENIYISIYESGSWDDSKGALRSLDAELGQLGVPQTVILDKTTHADELANPRHRQDGLIHPGPRKS